MGGPNLRWEGRRYSETERLLAYQWILEGRSYVEIAAELDCSLKFLYRQFGAQRERARREPVRSPLHILPRDSGAAYALAVDNLPRGEH